MSFQPIVTYQRPGSFCRSYVDQYQDLLSNSTQEAERKDLEKYMFTIAIAQGDIQHFHIQPDDPPKLAAYLNAGPQSLEKGFLPVTFNPEKWLTGMIVQ